MWNIADALTLVRDRQPLLHGQGWHMAMGGGVLNTGVSAKDLDLYFIPMDSSAPAEAILPTLETWWGPSMEMSKLKDNYPDDTNFEHKVKFHLPSGQRIDAFIMPLVEHPEFEG